MVQPQQRLTRERPDTFVQTAPSPRNNPCTGEAGHTFFDSTSCSIALSNERSAIRYFDAFMELSSSRQGIIIGKFQLRLA
jgi:hypothetical protein